MLVVGTMDWPKTLETGQFFCPACESVHTYRRRASRPFLTIYFIPVIPIGGPQEYVECRNCKASFEPSVLGTNSTDSKQPFPADLLKVVSLTMLEDRRVTEAEIARALVTLQLIGQTVVTRDELGQSCSSLRTTQMRLGTFLWTAKSRLSRQERLQVLKAIFLVASAEGAIGPSRLKALLHAQRTLELSDEEVRQCVEEAEQMDLTNF